MDAASLLTGVGYLYVAPIATTFPELDAEPASPWVLLGMTQDGLEVVFDEKDEDFMTDQLTAPVKAVLTESRRGFKTKLAENTLENLAVALGNTVVDTPADVGEIGTREVPLYRAGLTEYAWLFRGSSPYIDGAPAQYELPRGYITLENIKFDKAKLATIPITVKGLADLSADPGDEYGRLIAQDAAATEA